MSAVLPESAATMLSREDDLGAASAAARTPAGPPAAPMSIEPSAAERLRASRERLRDALLHIAHPPPKPSLFDQVGLGPFGDIGDRLFEGLRKVPGMALLLESVEGWWHEHPLRTAGLVAKEASAEVIGPIARRNPYTTLLGAAALGALFAVSRPWRWLIRPALFMGIASQIAGQALRRLPVDSWVHVLSALARRPPRKAPPP